MFLWGSDFKVKGSTSTKTGFALLYTTACALETKDKEGKITGSYTEMVAYPKYDTDKIRNKISGYVSAEVDTMFEYGYYGIFV